MAAMSNNAIIIITIEAHSVDNIASYNALYYHCNCYYHNEISTSVHSTTPHRSMFDMQSL